MVAIGYEKYGSQAEFDKDPIMHLYNVYVKVTADAEVDPDVKVKAKAWFKRMEDGDEDVLKKWHGWRDISLAKYQEAYKQLNIHFDVYTGESNVSKESMDAALSQLQDMGLISDREGAMEIDLSTWDLNLKAPILRKAGASLLFSFLP